MLNFGVCGYGTAAELELYDSRVRGYQPDLVLLAYVLNDPIPPQLLTEMDDGARRRTRRFQRVSAVSQFAWLFLAWQEVGERRRAERNYDVFYRSPVAVARSAGLAAGS